MTKNAAIDPLADLGLDITTSSASSNDGKAEAVREVQPASVAEAEQKGETSVANSVIVPDAAVDAAVSAQEGDEVADDFEIELGTIDEIPQMRRLGGGSGGSKYPFDKLAAPTKKNGKPQYFHFTVKFPGGDEAKFKRSIQSATTSQNRNNESSYYITRTVYADGKFVGIQVIRTDERPAKEEAEAAAE